MPATSKIKDEQTQELVNLYVHERWSATMLAKHFNTTVATITSTLKKHGVEIRTKNVSISEAWGRFKQTDSYEVYLRGLSKRHSNKKVSQATREKQSKSRAEGILNGTIQSRVYSKSKWHEGIFCRSSYEIDFINFCKLKNIRVEQCKYTIPYTYEGVTKTYLPDFYLPDSKSIIEVKPLCFKDTEVNRAKFKAAREFCLQNDMRFTVITEATIYNKRLSREEYSLYN